MDLFQYKYMMLYYKVMRRIRAMMDLGPLQIRAYLDRLAFLNPVPKGTVAARISFGEVECDEVRTKKSNNRVLLFCIHGGAFAFGSARTHRTMAANLCELTGGIALLVDYRRTPEHRYPAALDDCEAAWRGCLERYSDLPKVFIGDSAGGNLAAALQVRCLTKDLASPSAICLLSPWLDLRKDSTAALVNFSRDSVFDKEDLAKYATLYADDAQRDLEEVSPLLSQTLGRFAPTLLQVAKNELLFSDSKEFHEALVHAGAEAVLDKKSKLFHSWQLFPDYFSEARKSLEGVSAFILERV
jgi:epsilon-lactone hydrolase